MRAFGRESHDRHREEINRRQRETYRARMEARPKPPARSCAFCGTDISHRSQRAKWCHLRCRDKARHRADPSRARNKIAALRIRDPERVRATTAAWRERNRERYLNQTRRAHQKRRAWKAGTAGDILPRSWHRLLVQYDFVCAYCRKSVKRLVQEHVVPLSRGGRHGEGNIVPACQPCNNSKSDRLLVEWRAGRRITRKGRPAISTSV